MTVEDCVLCVPPGRWAKAKVLCQPGSNMFSTMNSSVKNSRHSIKNYKCLEFTTAIMFGGILFGEGKSITQLYHSASRPQIQ